VRSRSYSQAAGLSAFQRLEYLKRIGLMHVWRLHNPGDYSRITADFEYYKTIYEREVCHDFSQARILEIGYGQRPFRILMLHSLGYHVQGIDADQPLYQPTLSGVISLFKSNGTLRAMKSLARRIVFDPSEYRKLAEFISVRYGRPLSFNPKALFVGDAADHAVWSRLGGLFDFIYSEDVFEHIPRQSLSRVVSMMSQAMTDDGIAVVTPMVFTGICGGHEPGWYPHQVDDPTVSRGPAWGHLTDESVPADTNLNRLTRQEFRLLFQDHFEVVHEFPTLGDIGRNYLTPERQRRLKDFGDDELFSNSVRFALRKNSVSRQDRCQPIGRVGLEAGAGSEDTKNI
jgi:hypothetical protein